MSDPDVDIHFAFADGVLQYDCASCDQRCCKTGGLVLFPSQRELLLKRYPALELVAPVTTTGIDIFATPPAGCWFLADEQCRLSGDSSLRPGACALFPFNLFGLLGETLVVAPNALNGICTPTRKRLGQKTTPVRYPQAHLTSYKLANRRSGIRVVQISNQFGRQLVATRNATRILVPSAKRHCTRFTAENLGIRVFSRATLTARARARPSRRACRLKP